MQLGFNCFNSSVSQLKWTNSQDIYNKNKKKKKEQTLRLFYKLWLLNAYHSVHFRKLSNGDSFKAELNQWRDYDVLYS